MKNQNTTLRSLGYLLCGCSLILFTFFNELEFRLRNFGNLLGGGDSLFNYALAAHRYTFNNDPTHFGYPFGMYLKTFPTLDTLNYLIQFPISFFTQNPIFLVNSTIVFLNISNFLWSYFLARYFLQSHFLQFIFALNVSLLPWAFHRIEHVNLLFFASVLSPLLLLKERVREPQTWQFIVSGMIIGLQTPYFCFFALLIILIINLMQNFRNFREAVIFILGLVGSFILNVFVTSGGLFQVADVFTRNPLESYFFGGEPILLLLPLPIFLGIRSEGFISVLNEILGTDIGINEASSFSNFGNIAIVCAVIFLIYSNSYRIRRREPLKPLEKSLALILLVLYLFYIKAGLGFFFSFFIYPQLRSWNRLTPILQSIVLLLGAYVLDQLVCYSRSQGKVRIYAIQFGVSILAFINIFQSDFFTNRDSTENYIRAAKAIRSAVPTNCGILQLPNIPFPEYPRTKNLGAYDHFAISMHDRFHSYSFGAVKSTEASDEIELSVISLMSGRGILPYCAVLLDRRGDEDSNLERALNAGNFNKKVISVDYVLYVPFIEKVK